MRFFSPITLAVILMKSEKKASGGRPLDGLTREAGGNETHACRGRRRSAYFKLEVVMLLPL